MKWRVDLHEEKDSSRSIFMERARKAGEGGLTCFDVRFVNIHLESTSRIHLINGVFFFSPNGKFLAFGSSDYSLGMLESTTLSVSHRRMLRSCTYIGFSRCFLYSKLTSFLSPPFASVPPQHCSYPVVLTIRYGLLQYRRSLLAKVSFAIEP